MAYEITCSYFSWHMITWISHKTAQMLRWPSNKCFAASKYEFARINKIQYLCSTAQKWSCECWSVFVCLADPASATGSNTPLTASPASATTTTEVASTQGSATTGDNRPASPAHSICRTVVDAPPCLAVSYAVVLIGLCTQTERLLQIYHI